MKIPLPRQSVVKGGFTLIEIIVYLSVATFVVVTALVTMFESWDSSRALGRDADDIVRALHAGEQWRADLRAAAGPPQWTESNGAGQLRIPSAAGEIDYSFSDGKLRRQSGALPAQTLLSNVKSSRMESDHRGEIKAWRWELELKTARRTARIRPLFTFEGVAQERRIQ